MEEAHRVSRISEGSIASALPANLIVSSGQSVWTWRTHNASVSDDSENSSSPQEDFMWPPNIESRSPPGKFTRVVSCIERYDFQRKGQG